MFLFVCLFVFNVQKCFLHTFCLLDERKMVSLLNEGTIICTFGFLCSWKNTLNFGVRYNGANVWFIDMKTVRKLTYKVELCIGQIGRGGGVLH